MGGREGEGERGLRVGEGGGREGGREGGGREGGAFLITKLSSKHN